MLIVGTVEAIDKKTSVHAVRGVLPVLHCKVLFGSNNYINL